MHSLDFAHKLRITVPAAHRDVDVVMRQSPDCEQAELDLRDAPDFAIAADSPAIRLIRKRIAEADSWPAAVELALGWVTRNLGHIRNATLVTSVLARGGAVPLLDSVMLVDRTCVCRQVWSHGATSTVATFATLPDAARLHVAVAAVARQTEHARSQEIPFFPGDPSPARDRCRARTGLTPEELTAAATNI